MNLQMRSKIPFFSVTFVADGTLKPLDIQMSQHMVTQFIPSGKRLVTLLTNVLLMIRMNLSKRGKKLAINPMQNISHRKIHHVQSNLLKFYESSQFQSAFQYIFLQLILLFVHLHVNLKEIVCFLNFLYSEIKGSHILLIKTNVFPLFMS